MRSMPDAVILCGGAGLRLRCITGDNPKTMAAIADRPFLEILIRQLRRNHFSRVVLAVGYRKEVICSYFGDRFLGIDVVYSDEASPLGTGGALRNAAELLTSDAALVMNGDSYTDADLFRFVTDHYEHNVDASLLLVKPDDRNDCGTVLVGNNNRVHGFQEKMRGAGPAYVNAGIYVLSKMLLLSIPVATQVSIEHQLFPQWLSENKLVRASLCDRECVDIGTPERYRWAQTTLAAAEFS